MNKFVIIANGPFPKIAIIREAIAGKRVLALDGAINNLFKYNIIPDVILGDFDSVSSDMKRHFAIQPVFENMRPYLGADGVLIVPAEDQNYTDLEKGIQYCDESGAQSITILCATGGRLDHHEALRVTLQQKYKVKRKVIVHSDFQSMCYVQDETFTFHGKARDKCGFTVMGDGYVKSAGLKYICNKNKNSFANELLAEVAKLEVVGGALVILPPQLHAQRN